MSAVSVRMPEREDEPEWLRLRYALWPECAREQHELDMGMLIADADRTAVFVAPVGGERLAGFVEVALRPWHEGVHGGPVAVVEALYVSPEERGHGVGHALLGAAEAWAEERGACGMLSEARSDNERGRLLHQHLGYEERATTIRMHKPLAAAAHGEEES
jgi:aminoglycoside 6'-N-acetyltransferase I